MKNVFFNKGNFDNIPAYLGSFVARLFARFAVIRIKEFNV